MRSLLFGIVLVLMVSCGNSIIIERSERFVTTKAEDKTIICIDPQVKYLDGSGASEMDEIFELESFLKDELAYSAKENDLQLKIVSLTADSDAGYYQELLSLKKEFLQANNYQNTPLNFKDSPELNSIKKSVFVYPPRIAHDYTSLSKTYGTPYFSFIGIYKESGSILFYHLIVNTNTAETVYREFKTLTRYNIRKKSVSQMVYDSMAMLKEEFK